MSTAHLWSLCFTMLTRPLPSWCLLAPGLTCPLPSWHLQAWTLKYLLINLALRRLLHSNAHFPSLASVGQTPPSELWRHIHSWVNCNPVLSRNMNSHVDFSVLCRYLHAHVQSYLLSAGTWTPGPLAFSFLCMHLHSHTHSSSLDSTGNYMPMHTALCWSLQHLHSHAQFPLTSAYPCTSSPTAPLCTLETPVLTCQ